MKWFFLIYGSVVGSVSLLAADQELTVLSRTETDNHPQCSLKNVVARVQYDLAQRGYATFEDTTTCPLSQGDLKALNAIFDRVAIPYREIEDDAHNNAHEFVILLCFSKSPASTNGAQEKYVVKDISVSNNDIKNDDMATIISVVRHILTLLGDEDLGSVFTVNLTYYDEFRKIAEAFEVMATSLKEPTLKMLKLNELPWHQDKFGDYFIDFLGLFVLDSVGIGPHYLQLGLIPKDSLEDGGGSAANASKEVGPAIVASIMGKQGAGYFVDQSRDFDSSMIVHRRTALRTYFSNTPLSENMMESDPEFLETTAHGYLGLHNNCCASDYVRPSRKVLIVRIKKDSEI